MLALRTGDVRYAHPFLQNIFSLLPELPSPCPTRITSSFFDVRGILNIDRFRHININATCRSQVYLDCASVAASERIRFLSECVKRFPRVDFADRSSGRIWALVEAGELVWCDPEGLSSCATDDESRAALEAVLQKNLGASRREAAPPALNPESFYTIGLWGESRDAPLG